MAKKFKKILVLAVIFTMTLVNYGLPLQAIASEGGSFFSFAFFRKNEIALDAYFGDDSEVIEDVQNVNETAKVTLEVSPLIEGYLKSGSLKFNLKNGNENNFKLESVMIEEKEELELDEVDTLMLEEAKDVKAEDIVTDEATVENSDDSEEKVDEVIEDVTEAEDVEVEETSKDDSEGFSFKNLFNITSDENESSEPETLETSVKEPENTVEEPEENVDESVEDEPEEVIEEINDEDEVVIEDVVEEDEELSEEEILEKAKGCYEVSLVNDNEIALKNIIDSTKIFVEISYKQSEVINPEDLFSEIEIVLEGNYINKKLETLEVTRTQELTLGWEYSKEVKVASEITKVSPFTVGKNSGTIIENIVTVTRNIEDNNFLPIKQTNIKIEIPKINDKLPIAVNVAANKLMATLGKELTGKEFTKDNWSYDEETGILIISVSNKDLLAGSGEDKFDIICRYEDYLEDKTITLDKKVLVQVEEYSSKDNNIQEKTIEEAQEIEVVAGELMSYAAVENEETIGKGKINANYHIEAGNTRFSSMINVTVLTSDILDEVLIEPVKETYINKDDAELDASIDVMYTGVRFNLAEIKEMLAQGTTIDLLDGEGNVFHTITKDVDATKIEFASQIDTVKVRINDVKVNGNLSIEFVKTIGKSQYSAAEFAGIEKIENTYKAEVKYVGFEDTFQLSEVKDEIKFTNTITQVNLLMNKSQLSTIYENENVEFKIDLINNLETSDLYKNPSFELVFPSFVKEVKLNNIYTLYQNGLSIRDYQVVNENGRNRIIINLDGIQNGFNFSDITNGTNVIVNTNLVVDEITPQKQDEVELYYCNEAVTNYQTQANWNISKEVPEGILSDKNGYDSTTFKYQAPSGLIAINAITNYDGTGETVKSFNQGEIIKTIAIKGENQVATMELSVLNNTDNTYTDMILLGRIPFKGNKDVATGVDLGTNVDTIMKSLIVASDDNSNNATIYYSINPNADSDLAKEGNGWVKDISSTDLMKSFMIVIDGEVSSGGILKYQYDFEISANLGYEVKMLGSFGAFGNTLNSSYTSIADKVGLITESGVKYEASMSVDIGDGAEVGEGRYLKYTVRVENTGSVDFQNIKMVIPKPNYTYLCSKELNLDEGNDGYITRYGTEERVYSIDGLKAGETIEKEVVVKTDLIPETIEEYAENLDNAIYDENSEQYYILNELNEKEFITELPKEFYIENFATVYIDGAAKGIDTNTVKNKLVDSNFDIEITPYKDEGILDSLISGTEYMYVARIENISGKDLSNIVIEDALPKELKFVSFNATTDAYEVEYDEENNIVTITLEKLENSDSERLFLKCSISNMKNIGKANISNFITVKTEGIEEKSSVINSELVGPELVINQEIDRITNEVKELEKFDYIFSVNNKGNYRANYVKMNIDIPEGLEIVNISFQGDRALLYESDGNKILAYSNILEKNENTSLVITLKSKVLDEGETNRIFDINAKLTEEFIGDINTETLTVTVLDDPNRELTSEEVKEEQDKNTIKNPEINEDYENLTEDVTESEDTNIIVNTNQDSNTTVESNTATVESVKTYEITGKVWKDTNKNNAKDSNEDGVKKVQVSLYKGSTKIKTIVTDSLGNYRFTEISNGDYTILFEYDGNEYMAAKYKLTNVVESENSDAIESEAGMAITEVINVKDEDVVINLGLQDRDIFDLSVQKYITKATVTTNGKEKVEEYDSKELAKLEIRSKELKNTTIELEYKIVVTNTGSVNGQLEVVYDYLPESLSFDASDNKDWKLQGNGVLYNETLKGEEIKPGEKRELKLILTKVMTDDNTGTISNKVEISGLSSNNSSTEVSDNNIATQEIIITVSTGRTVSIVIMITILILATILVYGIRTGRIKRKYV